MINRRDFIAGAGALLAGASNVHLIDWTAQPDATPGQSTRLAVDLGKQTGALPHFWELAAGSDRTVVGLRDQWRKDLIRVQRDVGIRSVRCHGLFDDEMGIASGGAGNFNFLYVDQIYDFMLDHDVRPFVELSFMPEAFARSSNRIMAYKGNTSPPREWKDWRDMVHALADHCVKRYGIREVSTWKFEVWNEPNIAFWSGTQDEYFEMYRQSVMAIKEVDRRLQVGGPSTAQLDWIPEMIQYCVSKDLPLDFVSTHVYPDDPQKHIFGQDKLYRFEEVIPRGLAKVKEQVASSKRPHTPLWLTEWSSQNPAFIAETVNSCIGLTDAMSYWTFSNVFEEGGVPSGLFNRTFGMLDQWGIARPSFHTFTLMHRLGDTRLSADTGPVLATRRADGSVAILVWNLIPAGSAAGVANGNAVGADSGGGGEEGSPRTFHLRLHGAEHLSSVSIRQVNLNIGSAIPAWKEMGSPRSPSAAQIVTLQAAAELPAPVVSSIRADRQPEISLQLPPNGVALLELSA